MGSRSILRTGDTGIFYEAFEAVGMDDDRPGTREYEYRDYNLVVC